VTKEEFPVFWSHLDKMEELFNELVIVSILDLDLLSQLEDNLEQEVLEFSALSSLRRQELRVADNSRRIVFASLDTAEVSEDFMDHLIISNG